MRVADENLRHRAPAAALDHLRAALGLRDDVDLGELDALLGEQPLRRVAEAAERRRINDDSNHARAHLTRGRFSARQPLRPPFRLKAFSKPALRSCVAARPEFSPLSQTAITTLFFCFFSTGWSGPTWPSSMLRALTICPSRTWSGLRTSITTAPPLISRTASAGAICTCPRMRARASKTTAATSIATSPATR